VHYCNESSYSGGIFQIIIRIIEILSRRWVRFHYLIKFFRFFHILFYFFKFESNQVEILLYYTEKNLYNLLFNFPFSFSINFTYFFSIFLNFYSVTSLMKIYRNVSKLYYAKLLINLNSFFDMAQINFKSELFYYQDKFDTKYNLTVDIWTTSN
jgi:hypothetical protein